MRAIGRTSSSAGHCCCVIGNQAVLEAIAEELKVAAAPEHATNDGIESCLFALRGVADYVGHSDNHVIEPALHQYVLYRKTGAGRDAKAPC